MRTLDTDLQDAFDSGAINAYLRVHIHDSNSGTPSYSAIPLHFKLSATEAEVTFAPPTYTKDYYFTFYLERGCLIDGVANTINSSWFYSDKIMFDGKFVTIHGTIFKPVRITVPGDDTYQNVITQFLLDTLLEPTFEIPAAAWLGYQFFPSGKSILFNDPNRINALLRQKRFIFLAENGFRYDSDDHINNVLIFSATDFAYDTEAAWYTLDAPLAKIDKTTDLRYLMWRDENETLHYSGYDDEPLHNLGYLESTDDAPSYALQSPINQNETILPINLKYQTGDQVEINPTSSSHYNIDHYLGRIEVIEVFDPTKSPSWHNIIKPLVFFGNTEGGTLPSTIERVSNYTPLSTGTFDQILSDKDNNVQAAFETLDEHTHTNANADASQYLGGDGEFHDLPYSKNLFLSNTASDLGGSYKLLTPDHPSGAEQTVAVSCSSNDTLINEFVTAANPFDFLSEQIAHVHIHAAKTAGTKGATMYAKLFHRSSGGTETLIGTSSDVTLTGSNTAYDLTISIADTDFAATDRLELNFYGSPSGSGTAPTVTIYFEGTNNSRIEVGVNSGSVGSHTHTESDLNLSDVTTANVSTSKHGFAPKAPNDATKYLDGSGAWTVPAGSGDGWTSNANTWTYSSADAPTFIISINADMTAILQVGMRIKLTQTTVKYFIVTAVGAYSGGATLVTVYGGTDYTLANAAITSPYYSGIKSPFGFPITPAKWTVTLTDTSDRTQLTPTQNQVYNMSSLSITIPIGVWQVSLECLMWSSSSASQTQVGYHLALSTANNSISDNELRCVAAVNGASGTLAAGQSTHFEKLLTLTSKTTYYVVEVTYYANVYQLILYNSVKTFAVYAVCAYL